MRSSDGVERTSFHREILKALAQAPERTALPSRELATKLGESIQSVAARLQPLVRAGLVSKHWGTTIVPGRAYMITEEGRGYLARVERRPPTHSSAPRERMPKG